MITKTDHRQTREGCENLRGQKTVRKVAVLVMKRSRIYFNKPRRVNHKTSMEEDVMELITLCFEKLNLYDN